ncbi:MAG: hypothetical protein R3C61_14465, partial [Bacteroidia bacterium]
MIWGVRTATVKKAQTILTFIVRNLVVPVLNISISLLVIRSSSRELWGNFISILIWVNLALHILSWGSREYLLRQFSQTPSLAGAWWYENFFTRLLILPLAALFFLAMHLPIQIFWGVLLWLAAGFVAQSWEVVGVFQKRFGPAILAEFVGFLGIGYGVFFWETEISVEKMVALYSFSALLKAVITTAAFRRRDFVRHRFSINKQQLSGALPFLLLGLTGMLNNRVDLYMVSARMGEEQVAVYQV